MNPLAYLAATWLGINAGIATALTAAYRRHNRHLTARGEAGADLMAIIDATAEPACTCDEWTADELVALAPDLAVLDAVETYADFLYLTGGDPE